jgi:Arc/MetJ-type ribon-helix-helix transcriptional regulator
MHSQNGHESRPQIRMRLSRDVRAMLKAEVERRPMTSESAIIETAVKQLLSPEVQRTHLDTQLAALRKEIHTLAHAPKPLMPNVSLLQSQIDSRLASHERIMTDLRHEVSQLQAYLRGAEKRYFIRVFSTIGGMSLMIGAAWYLL